MEMKMVQLKLPAVFHWLRKFIRFLLLALFTLGAIVTLIGHLLVSSLTAPTTYHGLIEATDLGEGAPHLAAALIVLVDQGTNRHLTSFVGYYPLHTWEATAETLLPADWLTGNLHVIVDAVFDWLNDPDSATPDVTLNLSPLVATLRTSRGAAAVLPLLQNARPCASASSDLHIFGSSLISCLPPGRDIFTVAETVASQVANSLPEEISLVNLQAQGRLTAEAQLALATHRRRKLATEALRRALASQPKQYKQLGFGFL